MGASGGTGGPALSGAAPKPGGARLGAGQSSLAKTPVAGRSLVYTAS